jgi:hypothetical protein
MNVINNIVISDYHKKDKLIKIIDSNKYTYPFANITRIKKLFTKDVFGETVFVKMIFTDSHYNKIIKDLDNSYKSYDYIWHVYPPETVGMSDTHKIQFTEEDIKLFLTMDRCMYTDEEYSILMKWLDIHKKIYEKFVNYYIEKINTFEISHISELDRAKSIANNTAIIQFLNFFRNNDDTKVLAFFMVWNNIINSINDDKLNPIFTRIEKYNDIEFSFKKYINSIYEKISNNKNEQYIIYLLEQNNLFRQKKNLKQLNF